MNKREKVFILFLLTIVTIVMVMVFSEESQNKISRAIGNSIGYKYGQVDIYIGQKEPVKTFLSVEKLSTAISTQGKDSRPYRFGFGYIDMNNNGILDENEKNRGKKYFELPNYSQYIYFDNSK